MEYNVIDSSLELAIKTYKGITEENGNPAILKALRIGLMGCTDEEKATGFLHDIMSVPGLDGEMMREYGIHDNIIMASRILFRQKEETMDAYTSRVLSSNNPIATRVLYYILRDLHDGGDRNITPLLEKVKAYLEGCSEISLYEPESGCHYGIFAGGCFWGVQHEMEKIDGVTRTLVGYTGGEERFPKYEEVRSHGTSHVEAVLVEYDPKRTTYKELLKTFFEIHDQSQMDGQGPDIGPQYLSCIFTTDEQQRNDVSEIIGILTSKGYTVNTRIFDEGPFWIGEEYHQHYYERTQGEPYCHIRTRKF